MISVAEARQRIIAAMPALGTETLPLAEASGRILAENILAQRTQPPSDISAMDGYAVRAGDLPGLLRVIGTSAAGHPFGKGIGQGEAVRIFTGAVLPQGADAILIQENATAEGDFVRTETKLKQGQHIRRGGYDFKEGALLVRAGARLDARAIAIAAAGNSAMLPVRRKPRVAILATGDELVRPGEPLGPGQIVSSNNLGLGALVRAAGGIPIDLGIAADTPEAIVEAAERGSDAEILVTIGGASVGDHDLVQPALAARGFVLDFWRIAMRPGKPLMFGQWRSQRVFGLPGNPVAALVCGLLFLRPALQAAQGLDPSLPIRTAPLGTALPANDQREDYLRASFSTDASGRLVVNPFPIQDSAMLSLLLEADVLAIRKPHAPPAPAGSAIDFIPLAGLL